MARRKQPRKIVEPPKFKGYRPYGNAVKGAEAVDLLYEEYEAIKLADYDGMSHDEACILMNISRPTFARIYKSARMKIARALVEVKPIRSVYGNALMDKNWFQCQSCINQFTIPASFTDRTCPICKSEKIEQLNQK